jgi:hypothetical protein
MTFRPLRLCVLALLCAASALLSLPALADWDDSTIAHYFPDLTAAAGLPSTFALGSYPSTAHTFPYVNGIVSWPVTVRIKLTGGQVTYVTPPALPALYSELMFQGILVELSDLAAPTQAKVKFVETNASQQSNIDLTWFSGSNQTFLYLVKLTHLPLGQNALTLRVNNQAGALLGQLPLTVSTTAPAHLNVTVNDAASGMPTPARVGVLGNGLFAYADSNPAMAVTTTIPIHDDFKGTLELEKRIFGDYTWPLAVNRAFYTRGKFSLALRPGTVDLVVSKGLEYKRHQESFVLAAGQTASRTINLTRQTDTPSEGWYSVDDHAHVSRTGATDGDLLDWARAEDIHFANIVQMGDIQTISFPQSSWGAASEVVQGNTMLHSAQEDPRTPERGHALTFGNTSQHWDPSRYYIYEDVFDATHAEGGLTGYAHNGQAYYSERGLAIDMPLGKTDFIEMQLGTPANLAADSFYDWWNLGIKVTVTSGSDFPFGDYILGRSLFYVYVDPAVAFNHDNVLAAIGKGNTYASNGPIVDFKVNGARPGTQLDLTGPQTLSVTVHARINPTLGEKLTKLELVSQSDIVAQQLVVAGGEYDTTMTVNLPSSDSRWIAAKVTGVNTIAHTTPVYVVIDGKSFWRADELYVRVPYMDGQLNQMEQQIANGVVPAAQITDLQDYIDQARAKLLAMLACPAVTISALKDATPPVGVPYADNLGSPNGYSPLLFFLASGSLPTGLTLASDGTFSGTPTVLGHYTFSVQVTDVKGCVGTQAFTMDVLAPDGTVCADGGLCASGFCVDGVCCDTACAAGPCDACAVATGAVANGTCALFSGAACDDQNACSSGDTCQSGVCTGANAVVCMALDACHVAGTCDPASGTCDDPAQADGTPCSGGTCQSGVCDAGTGGAGGGAGAGGSGTGAPSQTDPGDDGSCDVSGAAGTGRGGLGGPAAIALAALCLARRRRGAAKREGR